jgi:Heparinase II/III-like protein.
MALFFSESEKQAVHAARRHDPVVQNLYWALRNRAERRATGPDLSGAEFSTEWWHHAAEVLTDAAMSHSLQATPQLASWLRSATLAVVRRPVDDWIGPPFRDHSQEKPMGHLETAHLSWGVSVALDLAPEVFTEDERTEIRQVLRERAIPLCLQWIDGRTTLSNWRCVLTSGLATAAVVAGDEEHRRRAVREFNLCLQIFQPDGSHGESLQYGNYAALSLTMAREALTRFSPELAAELPMDPYARMPVWQACSLFYRKPLSGWGAQPMARSANFNDSAANFRPSADLLLHIAARARETFPREAGLARWLFDHLYAPAPEDDCHDRATFGFVNDFGFLSLALLPAAAAPVSPEEAGLPELAVFSCGDVIARDSWKGRTILAAHSAGDDLNGPGHLHGDLNSFILVHNRERLLVDPGHSCYRNLIRELDASSETHNTCTFSFEENGRSIRLQQNTSAHRQLDRQTRQPQPPVARGGRRLLAAKVDDVSVIAAECSAAYGVPITDFTRFWFLCVPGALFVVDRIRSTRPVVTTWHWLLNNRDGRLDLKLAGGDRLVARRNAAGMKLFHLGGGKIHGPLHAHVHDAYHPLPAQVGEGRPGSGQLIRWTEREARTDRTVVHAMAIDHYGTVAGWHLRTGEENAVTLEGPQGAVSWTLRTEETRFLIGEKVTGRRYVVSAANDGSWKLEKA